MRSHTLFVDVAGFHAATMAMSTAEIGAFLLRQMTRIEEGHPPDDKAIFACKADPLPRADLTTADWRQIRRLVFRRDKWTCVYCSAFDVPLACDHVVPVSRGGESAPNNLATACIPCNSSKGSKLLTEWKGRLA